MATIGFVFPHQVESRFRPQAVGNPPAQCTWQTRRLALTEAEEWHGNGEMLIHWGDAGVTLDVAQLLAEIHTDQARSLPGRSWIYYQQASHRLTFAVDRLGLFPILLAQRNHATLLASDPLMMAQLLGKNAQFAEMAGVEMLAFGQLLGNDSMLRDVLHLHAGALCTLEASGIYYLQHAAPVLLEANTARLNQAQDALVAAVHQCLMQNPETCLVLDGSADCLLLLAAAQAGGHTPNLLTTGYAHSPPLRWAAALAPAHAARLFQAPLSASCFISARHAVAQMSGGEAPLAMPHLLINPELVAQTRGMVLMTALGGNLSRGMPGSGPWPKDAEHPAASALFQPGLTRFLEAFPNLKESLTARLTRRLEVYQANAKHPGQCWDAVILGERTRRADVALMYPIARDYARCHPLMEENTLTAIGGLPQALRWNPTFQMNLLRRLSPSLAQWAETSGVLTPDASGALPSASVMPEATWLNRLATEITPALYQTLHAGGLSAPATAQGIHVLLTGPYRLEFLSRLASVSGWAEYLSGRQAMEMLAA